MKTALSTRILKLAVETLAIAVAPLANAAMPVVDLSNLAQAAKILQANQNQINKLGSILGVNTQQLDQLRNLTTAIGNAQNVSNYGKYYTPADIAGMIGKIPGLEGLNIESVFKSSGALDLFSKIPLNQWDKMVKDPYNYYTQMLMDKAIEAVGEDIGLNSREIQFVSYLKRQNPKYLNKEQAARELADIMLDRWQQEAKERRATLQALSDSTNEIAKKASSENTLLGQFAGQTAVDNQGVKVALAAAEQADAAATAQKVALDKSNSLLADQITLEQMRLRANAIRVK